MAAVDQALRAELIADGSLFEDYHPRVAALHLPNAERLLAIMEARGWPAASLVGDDGAQAAWLVLQHAIGSPAVMRRGLELLQAAVERGEVEPSQVAMVEDRIRTLEGRPQRYGTQHDWDERGELSPLPIEHAADVDERRRTVGLGPLDEQTQRLRLAAAAEGERPPPDPAAHRLASESWARSVGWRD